MLSQQKTANRKESLDKELDSYESTSYESIKESKEKQREILIQEYCQDYH